MTSSRVCFLIRCSITDRSLGEKSVLPIYRTKLHFQVEAVTCTVNNTEWVCYSVSVPSCLIRSYLVTKEGWASSLDDATVLPEFLYSIQLHGSVSANPLLIEIGCTSSSSYPNTLHCCLALVQNLHPLQGSWSNSIVWTSW